MRNQVIKSIIPTKSKGSKQGKHKKYGKNRGSSANQRYIAENRRLKNKLRTMRRTMLCQPTNKPLRSRLNALGG